MRETREPVQPLAVGADGEELGLLAFVFFVGAEEDGAVGGEVGVVAAAELPRCDLVVAFAVHADSEQAVAGGRLGARAVAA